MISSGDALKSLALEAALFTSRRKIGVGRKKQNYTLVFKRNRISEQRVALVPNQLAYL